MTIISIDGACRNPGRPECLSVGAVFLNPYGSNLCDFEIRTVSEENSTSQRGEVLALIEGLKLGIELFNKGEEHIIFVSDSEYVVNTVSKEWYKNWETKGWVTASNKPVKNADLWEIASALLNKIDNHDWIIFHIKGHILPFGVVTASKALEKDNSGGHLYSMVKDKLALEYTSREDKITRAFNTFYKINGVKAPPWSFDEMIVCNTVVDTIATNYINSLL